MPVTCVLGALLVLFAPVRGHAKLCGDDVQGQDVPCACGDTVVSDVVLTDDPVAETLCPADGLIVRAIEAPRGIVVDLRGKTLRGSGHGAGLWMLSGGPGGAYVISSDGPARLQGFRDGVVAQTPDALAVLDGIVVAGSRRDGVRIHGHDYLVNATEVIGAGRDGFGLRGRDFRVTATRAVHSGRHGYFVMGMQSMLGLPGAGNTSQGSGRIGSRIDGAWLAVTDCEASGAGKDGIRLTGTHHAIEGCTAMDNAGSGITGAGITWRLRNNRANGNREDGLVLRGGALIDEGGNAGSDNDGRRWSYRPAIQCAINGLDCGN